MKQVVEQGFLGDIIEIESHIDYFRPGSITHEAPKEEGSFYSLGIHTIRMISLFGRPDTVTYDIRNNEMEGAVDNYFDVGLHYGNQLKIKLKTNHVVAKDYPRFIVHGTNGSFIKYGEDQQENDLKAGLCLRVQGLVKIHRCTMELLNIVMQMVTGLKNKLKRRLVITVVSMMPRMKQL